jgi:uncharacterized protein (TIGR02147 family)
MAADLFESTDYRDVIRSKIESFSKKGYGQLFKLSGHLGIHSSLVSQVMKGAKNFTLEQAIQVATFLNLTSREQEYFLLLVQLERAGTRQLKAHFEDQLQKVRRSNQTIDSRRKGVAPFDQEAQAQYYSDWTLMAVWLAVSIKGLSTSEAIGQKLGLSRARVESILEFLLSVGLCVRGPDGVRPGVTNTHLSRTSPLVNRHHINWRLKSLANLENLSADELAFTAPVSLSQADFEVIRRIILDAVEAVSDTVEKSEPEMLACLNIDWFEIRGKS